MTPHEKLASQLSSEEIAEIGSIVNECYVEYDQREFDYFEYIESSIETFIDILERNTKEWQDAILVMQENVLSTYVGRERGFGWLDHFAGECPACGGLQTFRKQVFDRIEEVIRNFVYADEEPGEIEEDEVLDGIAVWTNEITDCIIAPPCHT